MRTPENQRRMLGKRSTRRMNAAGLLLWLSHAQRFLTCTCGAPNVRHVSQRLVSRFVSSVGHMWQTSPWLVRRRATTGSRGPHLLHNL